MLFITLVYMTPLEVHSLQMLHAQIQAAQHALDETHARLQALEEDLADFLDAYYTQIGADFERLMLLQQELQQLYRDAPTRPNHENNVPEAFHRTGLKRALQGFYHDIAREVHPDTGNLKAELMSSLNAAYARKSLSDMWQVKWELEQRKQQGKLSTQQQIDLAHAQLKHVQHTHVEMQKREAEIRQSESFQLLQHATLMRICGQDFIAMVRGRVAQQIAATKQKLVAARIQQRYWHHVQSQPANSDNRTTRENAPRSA